MIPQKTKRGAAALARLKVYEGVPPPYDNTKRMVIPDALNEIRVLRLQPGNKYCLLGRISHEVGWNHYDTIKLEEIRQRRATEKLSKLRFLLPSIELQVKETESDAFQKRLNDPQLDPRRCSQGHHQVTLFT